MMAEKHEVRSSQWKKITIYKKQITNNIQYTKNKSQNKTNPLEKTFLWSKSFYRKQICLEVY